MKATLFKYAAFFTVLFLCFTKAYSQSLPIASYGVWDRGGQITNFADPNVDFVMGIEASAKWESIELVKGTFDFSSLQTAIDKAANNNKLIRLSVEAGPDAPLWMYDSDTNPNNNPYPQVQKVYTNDGNDKPAWPFYPEYLSTTYQGYFWTFLQRFSDFIRNQPQEKFAKIAFVQVKTGCTGDEVPYKGLNPTVVITDQQWHDFRLTVFAKYKEYFNDVPNKKVVLTFNDVDPSDPNEIYAWRWATTNIDPAVGFGIKGGAFNRGHHLSDEQSYRNSLYNYLVNPTGLKLFSGSEMDGTTQNAYFQICEDMSYYWAALGGINVGLSTNNLNAVAMNYATTNPIGRETFRMFTKYAQQVYPATSTTAFSIFHDGLNSADTTRFPEGTYGQKRMDNQARYQAICNDPVYASRGAKMDDVFSATKGQVYQRGNQTGLNDAGWNIAEGNIERFITQIDPINTSIGLFRVRGAITASSSKYDRFARSFECKTNKNKMFFQVQSEFPANNKVLKFTIIWLDRNVGGTWAFQYRNATGLQSRSFTGTGGDIWKTETFTLSDAIINQGGERGSDFMLVNTDGNNQTGKQFDDIFNGIEMNIIGSKQAQTINFNAIPDKKVGDPDFSPGATTNSGLTISYASSNEQVANFVNGKIHLVGIGSTTITASQAGNNTYESASVSQELRVAMVNQTTITTAGTSTWTSPAGVKKITVECWGAGGGGGGAWAQCVGGGGAGGSYVTNTLAVTPLTSYGLTVGAGAGQATGTGTNGLAGGNTRFEWTTPLIANGGVGGFGSGVPSPVVPRAGAGGANVTGGSGGTITLGSSGAAGAVGTSIYGGSGGSGGNSLNSGAAAKTTVGAGNRATIAGGGGSGAYGPASPLTTGNNRGGTAAAGQVTISYILSVPDAPIIGTATATGLSGTASISFTVPAFDGNATITSYTATASPGGRTATINQSGSGSITITGLTNGTAYTFTVRATNSVGQSASSTPSNAATPVRTSQTIAFNAIPTKTFGDADSNAGAIASSGLAVYYDSSNVDVVRVENGLIQVIGVGTASITAYQDGDETYAPAIPVTIHLTVIKANQSISFNALPIKTFGDADFGLWAAASSGLAVTYSSSDETVAKTINGTISIVGAGTCTISAIQLGNTSYNATATIPQTLTVSKANQSISFNALPTKTFGDADFGLGATASSGLPVTYSSSDETIAKIVNGAIQILGAGTVSITASQAGSVNFNPATSVSTTLTVGRANQNISYTALPNKTFGDADFSAGAIASSGLAVTYASSDETVATIINGSIRIVGTGTSSITALQVGNLNFNPATAVSQQFIVAKANQTITFSPLTARSKIGDIDFSPGATISSGLEISYRSSNENIATIVNGNIHIIGGGTCEITASQAGNSNFNPALDVTNTLMVDWVGIKSPINGASFTVGNSVALEAEGLAKAGIDAMRFRIDGGAYTNVSTTPYILNVPGLTVGSHTIELQMKDLLNNRINATTITITIIKANQNISFNQLPNKTFGDADFTPGATASSGLPVIYTSSDNLVATIVNGAIQIVGVGNAIITASQDGNGTYNSATSASQLLTVIKANQNISFNALPIKTIGDAAFNAGATTNSGLVVAYSSSNNLVATVVNGAIDIVGVGTAIITASQTGNGNYNPANSVSQQLTVVKANQNISFNALPTKTFGDADFSAGAAASSGLAISYTSSDNLVAAIINGAIRIVGVGTATITASQAGDVNYNAAPAVTQVITVSKANQTITFNALPSKIFGDADFSLAATASSGLIVSYTSSNQAVATIVNGVVRIVSAGNCTITASQAGNSSYNVATSITQVLKILTVVRTVIAAVGNSTWTCPTGVTSIKVEAWGGGGSGGSSSTGGLGGGGAGGSFVANAAVSVVPGSSYALTVGAGGIPSSNGSTNGTAGGSTTFASSTPVIANGGAFGNKAVGTGTLNTAFGLGGTNTSSGSGGTTYILGTNGSNAAFGNSGAGGNGAFSGGAGGATKTSSGVGLPGAVPGGGGSGSFAALSGGRAGGAGGAGQIVITYNAEVANPGGRFKPTTSDNTVISDKSKQFKIYPNPVAAYSEFEYNLLEEGKVQLSIFALNGQVIKTLINSQTHLPGSYTKVFEGCDFPDGVYIAQLKIGNEIKNIKIVVKK